MWFVGWFVEETIASGIEGTNATCIAQWLACQAHNFWLIQTQPGPLGGDLSGLKLFLHELKFR